MTATTDTPRTNKASALEPAAGHCPKCFQSLASAQMRNQYRKQLAAARADLETLRLEAARQAQSDVIRSELIQDLEKEAAAARAEADELARRVAAAIDCGSAEPFKREFIDPIIARVRAEMEKERSNG